MSESEAKCADPKGTVRTYNPDTHVAVRKMAEAEAKQCWKDSCEWSISDDEADDHMEGWLAALRWAGVIKEESSD